MAPENDNDYQKTGSKLRIQLLKTKIENVSDPEEIMVNILDIFKDVEKMNLYCNDIYFFSFFFDIVTTVSFDDL